ncbi:MAG: GlmL-related ornithine degradation protein [Firmicutes bacterium]|nr:GlmL-related ornithine degradation protein [Bacillota bacterium]
MKVDILIAEIGSTTTVVNAFDLTLPKFIGQGQAATTVCFCGVESTDDELINVGAGVPDRPCWSRNQTTGGRGRPPLQDESTIVGDAALGVPNCHHFAGRRGRRPLQGDVRIGLNNAIKDLEKNLKIKTKLEFKEFLAASSAAGGLKMCVHGLVYDMTVRAAKEAALGAGAVLKIVTSGKLSKHDIEKVVSEKPGIILVAGGMDYGERETALYNFDILTKACPKTPFIYAGNIQNQDEIKAIARERGVKLYIADNVYPTVDNLNIEPARAIIQDVFEEHITEAVGMKEIRQMVKGKIMPTPGAVMSAAKLLNEEIGDLIVFDVGGATTDLHSVTEGSTEVSAISLSPEPIAKRTVEGDLGVFVNIAHVIEKIGLDELKKEFPDTEELIKNAKAIPETDVEKRFIERLTKECVQTALHRHAGKLIDFYTPSGKKTNAVGKDLTAVKYLVGTGGVLTQLKNGRKILESVIETNSSQKLTPREGAKILIDENYIMASLGVLSMVYREEALSLLKESLSIN